MRYLEIISGGSDGPAMVVEFVNHGKEVSSEATWSRENQVDQPPEIGKNLLSSEIIGGPDQ